MDETVVIGVSIGPKSGDAESYLSCLRQPMSVKRQSFPVVNHYPSDYEELLEACKTVAGGRKIEAVGLEIAGQISVDRSEILITGSLTDWAGRKVANKLSHDLHCPVFLGNDAEAEALTETLYAGAPAHRYWYVKVDYGIGGCLVDRSGKSPILLPSELGHQTVDHSATETRCGCRHPGCLESLAGGWSLERFGRPADELLSKQREEVIEWLTIGMYNILRIHPVQSVVFGGSLAFSMHRFIPEIQDRLRDRLGMTHQPYQLLVRLIDKDLVTGTLGALALLSQTDLFDSGE